MGAAPCSLPGMMAGRSTPVLSAGARDLATRIGRESKDPEVWALTLDMVAEVFVLHGWDSEAVSVMGTAERLRRRV